MKRTLIAALCLSCLTAPPPAPGDGVRFPAGNGHWVDLTHAFAADTVYWPTSRPFQLTVEHAGRTPAGFYYSANAYAASEHGGTHIDAPVHFAEGRATVDRLPLERLTGDAVVIDVAARAFGDPDYRIGVPDFAAWEAVHGRIPDGAIVLVHTGYHRYWPDAGKYLGTAERGAAAVAKLRFPGLDPAAATWLAAQRRIRAFGLDTASIDAGQSTTFESHRILAAQDIPGFENLANLDRLPATGAFVVALPMKIAGGSGGPLRVAAWVPDGP